MYLVSSTNISYCRSLGIYDAANKSYRIVSCRAKMPADLKCSHCGKTYTSRQRFVLEAHERMHTGELPFVCLHPGCERRFSRKDCMMAHFHKHSIVHKCPVESCGLTFGSSMDLYRHKLFHSRECTICGVFFKTIPLLRNHRWNAHNVCEFICTVGINFGAFGCYDIKYHT